MAIPRVLILRAPGTNCDRETAYAFELAGARSERVHINRLLENPAELSRFQILCIPGGFSYGDDVAAGRILANQIRHHLRDAVAQFQATEKLVLGICNGFQVLMKAGVFFQAKDGADEPATLTWNESGRYEDRWVNLATGGNGCVMLKGVKQLYLPIAHAEGKFVARDANVLSTLEQAGQLALRYCDTNGEASERPLSFPANPNGSMANVAGLCDATGRVLGMMPHPERHLRRTHHPRWTRGEGREPGDGLVVFQNAVHYF